MYWKKLSHEQIKERIFDALGKNLNYRSEAILGIPGTYLDAEEFYEDAPFLSEAPFLSALISNAIGEKKPDVVFSIFSCL